ncbi:MAG: hypothetical protein ACXVGO_08875 [Mycobacterium sp.]
MRKQALATDVRTSEELAGDRVRQLRGGDRWLGRRDVAYTTTQRPDVGEVGQVTSR